MSDNNNCFIAQGEYGRKFIESIHSEIERIIHEKENDFVGAFVPVVDNLSEGCLNKEPAMMYLTAEIIRNTKNFSGNLRVFWGALWDEQDYLNLFLERLFYLDLIDNYCDIVSEIEETDLCRLYKDAADCGSLHAQWWCAYCMEHGFCGFEKGSEASRKIIENIKTPLKTLRFTELDFLDKEIDRVVEEAYDADYHEDLYCMDNNVHIDPGWCELEVRCLALQVFMIYLGLTCGLKGEKNFQRKHAYCNAADEPHFDDKALKLLKEKTDWENWCKEHGMTTVGSDNQ